MSPSTSPLETSDNQAAQPVGPAAFQSIQSTQPVALQAMNPQCPQPDQPEIGNLRGGERSSCCPGRFCFCIPCPLPCDFCII
ncbi:uncharacterized protein GGS22DRAFT_175376 [Annulohypoxylon maeteangense]|uniref:uncharacterized protein n=1 Tax=Annulohypoxylon maeteangense TaxID=1927788 RepID=UPI002008B0F1|nr:uncharacterized protein GGS22DRAFT_175376 [Annulohypoxylon maeteangense]KAI0880334.1 hypothetical protein GGS22DRAFT_175376 [Annulohypoxylon maeteangense]